MFGPKLSTDMDEVIREISTTGFQGIECGMRFVPLEQRDQLMETLAKYNLELAAIHYNYMNWREDPKNGIEGVRKEATYMKNTANKNIMMSFMPLPGEDVDRLAEIFNEAAMAAAEEGVALRYHNHLAEFGDGARFIYTMLEKAPALQFGYDLGWAKRAGFDPIKLLEMTGKRCNYCHLRDPKNEVAEAYTIEAMRAIGPFPEFGEGETDLKPIVDYVRTHFDEKGWAVVEHEGGAPDVQRYVKAKAVLDALLK